MDALSVWSKNLKINPLRILFFKATPEELSLLNTLDSICCGLPIDFLVQVNIRNDLKSPIN
jgi:hypothetical protein